MDIKPLVSTTLAEDFPAGPFPGQHFHPKGSEVVLANSVKSIKLGECAFTAPDPVFLYLNMAEQSLSLLTEEFTVVSQNVRPLLFGTDRVNALKDDNVYNYMQLTMQFIVMLFSAIEAFLNQTTPVLTDYSVREDSGKVKKYKSKEDFERYVTTKRKAVFLSEYLGKGNPNRQSFWADFVILNNLRNEIIHLKTKGTLNFSCYQEIYKDLFDTDFTRIFQSIKDFLVFYKSDIF